MVKCTGRGLVVKRPGALSKVQMLNLVLGVGVFSLLPSKSPIVVLLKGMVALWQSNYDAQPQPQISLLKILSPIRSRMETLAKENLVRAKRCSHCNFQDLHFLTKENPFSLPSNFFPDLDSNGRSANLGFGGGKMVLLLTDSVEPS